jgi:hypothetical protein
LSRDDPGSLERLDALEEWLVQLKDERTEMQAALYAAGGEAS